MPAPLFPPICNGAENTLYLHLLLVQFGEILVSNISTKA